MCALYLLPVWTSTNYGGSVYAWNTLWNNTCVPVGGSMNNNGEAFKNNMPNWEAELFSTNGCAVGGWVGGTFQYGEADPNLSPWNNIVSSFKTF